MHYNQPFCSNTGNIFNNGYGYCFNAYNPPPVNNGFVPHSVVGEGDVNCVALPDGTCQFYFTPTANWWTPNAYPYYNTINTNHINPYCNPNVGTWFVRSITSPLPSIWNNSSNLRHNVGIPFHSLDCDMTAIDNGYQLKFHYDKWTSTTDIHYFYPCLRQVDYSITLPTKGCAAVQMDTPMVTNTVCQEIVCSKPCRCSCCPSADTTQTEVSCDSPSPCQRTAKRSANTKPTDGSNCRCASPPRQRTSKRTAHTDPTKACDCQCSSPSPYQYTSCRAAYTKPIEAPDCQCAAPSKFKRGSSTNSLQRLQLLPTDVRKQRIKLERKTERRVKSKSDDFNCACDPPSSLDMVKENVIESKSKDAICECSPPISVEKSVATQDACQASKGDLDKSAQSPSCWRKEKPVIKGDAFIRIEPESWCPVTEAIKKVFGLEEDASKTACCSGYCSTNSDIIMDKK